MKRFLYLVPLLLLVGCGSGQTEPAVSTTPPAGDQAAANIPPVHSDVDSSKPYAQRGDK